MAKNKKKETIVQVFLLGDSSAEINGILVSERYSEYGVTIVHRDEDFESTTFIPYSNLGFVRYFSDVE